MTHGSKIGSPCKRQKCHIGINRYPGIFMVGLQKLNCCAVESDGDNNVTSVILMCHVINNGYCGDPDDLFQNIGRGGCELLKAISGLGQFITCIME